MAKSKYALTLAVVLYFCTCVSSFAETTAEIAKRCVPSVVLVTIYDENERPIESGSGFVIGNEQVATSYHVVAGGVSASVKTADKIVYPVSSVLAADASKDIAILQVKKLTDVQPLPLGDSASVSLGETVVAIGSPVGLEGTITEGIVSAVRESEKFKTEVVQYSAPSSRGNSGGPLVNSKGEVIGVISYQMGSGQSLNFAIPVARLKELLSQPQERKAVSTLQAPLLEKIGSLSPRRRTRIVWIPGWPPYTERLSSWHNCKSESVTVRIDERRLRRVENEGALIPGTFYVTQAGVVKFHAEQAGQEAEMEMEYVPYRVAVLDNTGFGAEDTIAKRLKEIGDEVLTGAEVEAAVGQWIPQAEQLSDFRQLAQRLNCSRLIVASCGVEDNPYGVTLNIVLDAYDLNTGRRVLSVAKDTRVVHYPGLSEALKWLAQSLALLEALDDIMKKVS